MKIVDTPAFHRPRGEATRDNKSEAVIEPEDSPVEELVVKGAKRQTVIWFIGATEVEPTNMRGLDPDRSSV